MIQATPQPIFPRKNSINEAVEYIQGQLPITDPNKMFTLLMMFQNTVLHAQESTDE